MKRCLANLQAAWPVKFWDGIDAKGRAVTEAAGDNSVNAASGADIAAYKPIAEDIVKSVLEEVSAKGIDANAARAMIQGRDGEIADYERSGCTLCIPILKDEISASAVVATGNHSLGGGICRSFFDDVHDLLQMWFCAVPLMRQ